MCIKHNGSVTFEHTARIADGTYINMGILHDKPDAVSFFADGKDAGNVAKLTGHELQLEHRQKKTDRGLMKYPEWATETEDGKQTVYKTNNCTSLPLAQTITYSPNKNVKISFKLREEISDEEEYISDDDEVQIVCPTSNAVGGKAGGTSAKSDKEMEDKAATDKAAADKAAADNALRVQEINAEVNGKNDQLKAKLEEVDTLKKEIFKLRVSAAELTPDDDVKCKRMPVVVKPMAAETTQNAFSAFRENKNNEDILRKWEMNANKLLTQEEKVYNNRHVMCMMVNFYKAWALENPVRAAKYEKRATDFNEQHKLEKAEAAVQTKRKQVKKISGSASGGKKRPRTDKDEQAKKTSDEAEEEEDEDFEFNGAGYESD